MTATNHGLAGAAIALSLHNYPVIALPLAFASHFAMDALPHSGFENIGGHLNISKKLYHRTLAADAFLLTLSFVFLVANSAPLLVFACWFLAGSPDIAWAYRYVIKGESKGVDPGPKNLLNRFHSWVQWSQTTWGYLIELPVMAALFWYVSSRL